MASACPMPTPREQRYGAILGRVEADLLRTIDRALAEAAERAKADIDTARLDMEPPAHGYFVALAHQRLFCAICGADPETFAGGNAETAMAVIRNGQNIARHYWGATIEPDLSARADSA